MTQDQQKVREMVEGIRFAMLTTRTPDGELVSRPMTPQEVGEDFTILFITQRSTDVAQQADGQQVNLAFVDGSDFVSVSGTAEIRDDLAKKQELWNTANDAFCEGGPENPENVILAVKADTASYWDSPSAPVFVFNLLKAKVTGTMSDAGEHGTVQL